MANARVRRGRKTQDLVADRIRHLFPDAEGVPASMGGVDIKNTPGLAIEVKATANITLPAWLRQARKNSTNNALPCVVYRPVGAGITTIDDWGVVISFGDFVKILEALQ
jgi:hypothetical protein